MVQTKTRLNENEINTLKYLRENKVTTTTELMNLHLTHDLSFLVSNKLVERVRSVDPKRTNRMIDQYHITTLGIDTLEKIETGLTVEFKPWFESFKIR